MNGEQITSLVRIVLQFAGGFLVSRGYIDDSTMATISGALLSLLAAGWSIWSRSNVGLVSAAASVPGVEAITAAPKIANAVPSAKVTAR